MERELDDPLRYDRWIEYALRSVIRRALALTSTDGLPGNHHFYITFRTDRDGVRMPDYLRAEHSEEMAIVLQHEFEDLDVADDGFAVTLRFNGKAERLYVPFDLVTGFADPSVDFALQLKVIDVPTEVDSLPQVLDLEDLQVADAEESAEPPEAGEVIALDAFRKKT